MDPRVIIGVGDIDKGVGPLVWAIAEARRRGAELHAVRTWQDRGSAALGAAGDYRPVLQAAAAGQLRAAFDDAAGGLPADLRVALVVEEGLPAQILTGYASRHDDLLVLGRRTGRWWHLGAGTTGHCVRHAVCPVTVIPPSNLARPIRQLLRELQRDLSEMEGSNQ